MPRGLLPQDFRVLRLRAPRTDRKIVPDMKCRGGRVRGLEQISRMPRRVERLEADVAAGERAAGGDQRRREARDLGPGERPVKWNFIFDACHPMPPRLDRRAL